LLIIYCLSLVKRMEGSVEPIVISDRTYTSVGALRAFDIGP